MKTYRRASFGRRSTLIAAVACGLLVTAQPALAAPTPGAPAGSGITAATPDTPQAKAKRQTQPFDPELKKLPPPQTIPGTGKKFEPLTTPLKPMEPTALPGAAKAGGGVLKADAEVTPVTNGGATLAYNCMPRIYGGIYVGYLDSIGPYSDIVYTADVTCNFWLEYMAGVSAVVDWTQYYAGEIGYVGTSFAGSGSYGPSYGATEVQGDLYDGGRFVEIILELVLQASAPWAACNPLPGLRYLACDGLGTYVLHVVVGTGVLGTGLAAPVVRWAALGDSYSAGTGASSYLGAPNPPDCRRSLQTYSYRVGGGGLRIGDRGERISLDTPNLKACDGAKIIDMYFTQNNRGAETRQLDWVTRRTRLVTLSIGGNSAGFVDKLKTCVYGNCSGAPLLSGQEAATIQDDLVRLYQTIRPQMRRNSRLVVLGYPAFLPNPYDGADPQPSTTRCPIVNSQLDTAELRRIYEAAALLNNAVSGAVARLGDPGVRYVDVADAFRGHRICSDYEWANGVNLLDIPETFHPNDRGYLELASHLIVQAGIGT